MVVSVAPVAIWGVADAHWSKLVTLVPKIWFKSKTIRFTTKKASEKAAVGQLSAVNKTCLSFDLEGAADQCVVPRKIDENFNCPKDGKAIQARHHRGPHVRMDRGNCCMYYIVLPMQFKKMSFCSQ